MYEPIHTATPSTLEDNNLTTPVNKALESGAWTQSIIWSPNAPFRDFIQLELNEEDIVEDHPQGSSFSSLLSRVLLLICIIETVRPKKRIRAHDAQIRDKFNLSNDHFYEVSKEGGRHRVRQTFGQLVVEHAYPAQKLQLPFVREWISALTVVIFLSIFSISTRRGFRSRKPAHSTGPPYSSQPILISALAKCARRRRKRTKRAARLVRVAISAKGYIVRQT